MVLNWNRSNHLIPFKRLARTLTSLLAKTAHVLHGTVFPCVRRAGIHVCSVVACVCVCVWVCCVSICWYQLDFKWFGRMDYLQF